MNEAARVHLEHCSVGLGNIARFLLENAPNQVGNDVFLLDYKKAFFVLPGPR